MMAPVSGSKKTSIEGIKVMKMHFRMYQNSFIFPNMFFIIFSSDFTSILLDTVLANGLAAMYLVRA